MKIANTLRGTFRYALSLGAVFSFAATAKALDNYKQFNRDTWDFLAGTQYYRTESNYGSGGQSDKLGSGRYFQVVDFDFGTRYVYGKNSSVYLVGTVSASESKDGTTARSNSSFNRVLLGADYLAYSDSFDIVPEMSLLVPTETLNTNSLTDDTVLNGEGVMELRPRLTIQKDFGGFGGYAYSGVTYRVDRSLLVPWGVGTFLNFSNSRLGAEIFGYQSVVDDKDTNSKGTRLAYLTRADAGSFKFGAFNPSLIDTNIFYHLGVRGPWSLEIDGGISLSGNNMANGMHAGALIRYTFDMTSGYAERPRYTTPTAVPKGRAEVYDSEPTLSTDKKVNQFHEDTDDGVDQRLFRPKPTKRSVVPSDATIQKELDAAEMQIELKSNKKKKRRK